MARVRRFYDISRPVDPATPVWPGDAPFEIRWSMRIAAGDVANLGAAHLSLHTGTHADAPFHTIEDGARIGAIPLDAFLGPSLLVDVSAHSSLSGALIQEILTDHPTVERILVRTFAWSREPGFPRDFPFLETEAVAILAAARVRLIGTDAPSVDPFHSTDLPSHCALARAEIAILENLHLDDVPEGEYELIALPLRLVGGDASPVRAVLRDL